MSRITLPLRRSNHRSADRPITGSMLFPDLVWAHWVWQLSSRPHAFSRLPRWARRWLVLGSATDGSGAKAGPPPISDSELEQLRNAYEAEAGRFEEAEGRIIRAYWCATEASAVVLTEQHNRFGWLPWRRVGSIELHRVTDWVTADAPAIAQLLHSGDMLAVRINRVLTAVPRLIAMEWIFSEQSYLLGFVERSGGHPSRKETASTIERHEIEIDRLERYYDRAARKAARIWYFGGMVLGLGVVVGLGAVIPFVVEAFGHLDLASTSARTFYACFVAGALGAMVSVMTRMRQEDGVRLDYEVGELLIVILGAFRPVLGAIFGLLTYFAIDSRLLPLTPPANGTKYFYYALFAFAAGFSERFAHVILGSAELTVAKALSGGEPSEPAEPTEAPTTAAPSDSRRDRRDGVGAPPRPTSTARS
jgi:hypothetical protein